MRYVNVMFFFLCCSWSNDFFRVAYVAESFTHSQFKFQNNCKQEEEEKIHKQGGKGKEMGARR